MHCERSTQLLHALCWYHPWNTQLRRNISNIPLHHTPALITHLYDVMSHPDTNPAECEIATKTLTLHSSLHEYYPRNAYTISSAAAKAFVFLACWTLIFWSLYTIWWTLIKGVPNACRLVFRSLPRNVIANFGCEDSNPTCSWPHSG